MNYQDGFLWSRDIRKNKKLISRFCHWINWIHLQKEKGHKKEAIKCSASKVMATDHCNYTGWMKNVLLHREKENLHHNTGKKKKLNAGPLDRVFRVSACWRLKKILKCRPWALNQDVARLNSGYPSCWKIPVSYGLSHTRCCKPSNSLTSVA